MLWPQCSQNLAFGAAFFQLNTSIPLQVGIGRLHQYQSGSAQKEPVW